MKRVLVVLIIISLAVSVSILAQGYAEGYIAGQEDGREECDGSDHFVRGLIGGIIYIGFAVVDPPNSPPNSRLSDMADVSSDYQEGYIAGYEKEWQSCRLTNAMFGAASWIFFYLILAAIS